MATRAAAEPTKCVACGSPFPNESEAVELGHGMRVHIKCFRCSKCATLLSPSDKFQLVENAFFCKDHKPGLAKQLQDRARRGFKIAVKGSSKMFATPSKKQKPPMEVGVPTTLPPDHPPLPVQEDAYEEEEEDALGQTTNTAAVDEFETVLDLDTMDNGSRSELSVTTPHSAVTPAAATETSGGAVANTATTTLRRTSTVASTHSFSTSPSMVAFGEVASTIHTISSTAGSTGRVQSVQQYLQQQQQQLQQRQSAESSPRASKSSEKKAFGNETPERELPITSNEVINDDDDSLSPPHQEVTPAAGDEEKPIGEDSDPEGGATTIEDDAAISLLDRQSSVDAYGSVIQPIEEGEEGEQEGFEAHDEENVEGEHNDEEDEEDKQMMKHSSDPLNILTTAVARELEILPQSAQRTESDEDQEEVEQPWVYPPAHSGVSPIQISVVDPDHLWIFLEAALLERMAHSKVGGARRARFVQSEALKPYTAVPIYSRYRNPYVHIYLVRCETLQDYLGSVRPRLRAFREDIERREDPEWLMVLVESSQESKKVFDKMKTDFSKERVVTVSVSDDGRWLAAMASTTTNVAAVQQGDISGEGGDSKANLALKALRPAGDGQWGDLAQRVGTSIVRAYEHRRPLYRKSIEEEINREMDFNYFNVFTRCESLAFSSLQVDKHEEALELYADLNMRFKRGLEARDPLIEKVVKCGMMDESGSSVKRLPCAKLLFPSVGGGSMEQDAFRAQIHRTFPARIFDVERLPFRDLIGTSTVSGIQLQLYLLSRIVLNLLALGRAREAIETARQFVFALRTNLKLAYPAQLTCVDAWVVAASLEIVAAGHACASVFASEVEPADRVGMCLAQAILLERARSAMEDISSRDCLLLAQPLEKTIKFQIGRKLIPELSMTSHPSLLRETNLPIGLARAFYSSPESFRNMYGRLLEASAAHFVAAGRFRFASALTHRRAILLFGSSSIKRQDAQLLFEDAGRWWSGQAKTIVFGQGTADLGTAPHDNWPNLRAETCLHTGSIERIARICQFVTPSTRRTAMAQRIARDLANSQVKEDTLFPIELSVQSVGMPSSHNNQGFIKPRKIGSPYSVCEDDVWHGKIVVRYLLPELEHEQNRLDMQIDKVSIKFKRLVSPKVVKDEDQDQQQVEQQKTEESFCVDFISGTAHKRSVDGHLIFKATSNLACPNVGTYAPYEGSIWLKSTELRVQAIVPTLGNIDVVERAFPWTCELDRPFIVASGTSFVKQNVENDSVTKRQEFTLRFVKLPVNTSGFVHPECDAVVTCSQGLEFAERDGKASFSSQYIKFTDEQEKRFSIIVTAKKSLNGSSSAGIGRITVEIKSLKDGRTSSPQVFDFPFQPPIQVTHEIRLAENDVSAVMLLMENNVASSSMEGLSGELEIVSCKVANVLTDNTGIRSAPISPFPFRLTSTCPLRQSFLISGLGAIVPERVGGRSLILLQALVDVKFVDDDSTCTLSWFIPLVIRRAQVVRSRWKEGETFSFSPPIEDASFGIDWREMLDDDTLPITVNNEVDGE